MAAKKSRWLPYSKLVNKDKHFEPCPICGGQVMQARDIKMPRLNADPQCQECGCKFQPHEKLFLIKGFTIIYNNNQ